MSVLARRAVVVVLLVVGIASFWTADMGQTVGRDPLPRADKVLLFGIPRLGLDDVTSRQMPNLYRLGVRGAIGSLRVKTNSSKPNVAEAYATVGAGVTLQTGAAGMSVLPASRRSGGTTALESQRLITGRDLHGVAVIPAVPQMVANGATQIGTLQQLLASHRRRVAVVSNADEIGGDGTRAPLAPAALVVTDGNGVVATGDTTAALTEAAPEAPFGLAVDPDRFTRAVLAQFHKSDLVVADPGETLRAESYIPFQSKASADASRTRALRVTDDLLGDLVHRVPAGTRIIVFGVTPGDSSWALTPFVIAGSGIVPGRIDSPATHRAGMSTLTDLTPTILTSLGVPSPESLPGSAVRETPGSFSWSASRRYDRMFATHAAITKPMMLSSIILQSALFVGALVFIGLGRPGRRLSKAFELGTLIFASWPLATFLVRMSVALSSLGFATFAIVWVIAVAIGTITWKLARTPLVALFAIACATVTVIAVDLASGARLLFGSYFGYTPDTASRYFGINNSVFAILAACAVVAATIAVDRGVGRDGARTGLWAAIALLTVTIIVDGAPWMGADVGGILTLVPILGITMWALSGRKVRWTYVVAAVAAAGVALGIAIGSDLIRRPDQRSHVSRFFVGIGIGHSHEFMQTIAEKWAANTAALGQSLWTWVIPVAAVYGLYVIVVEHGMTRLLPAGSPVRIGVTSMLMVGLVGWLLNDSGIVVTALVFVYLGPLLILIALREMHRSGEAPRTPSSPMLEAP